MLHNDLNIDHCNPSYISVIYVPNVYRIKSNVNLSNFFPPKPTLITEFFFDYVDFCLLQILIYNLKFFKLCNISVPYILIKE